ncbi:hypothetical protein GGI07_002580 [Coemansia sp. Benny D115]|nr:hypothetical protein GGI07_002580 [Coemansia sp. Benny D115]
MTFMLVLKTQLHKLAVSYTVVLVAVNLYFYNYAKILSAFHKPSDIRFNIYGDPQIEGDAKIDRQPYIGKTDLIVNDYYLRHIYKSTLDAFSPQYAVTMGDIFSSQWVSKSEYYKRIHRFKWISNQIDSQNNTVSGSHLYYYLAGNHDIGYGEETRLYHIARYNNNFGPLNRMWYVNTFNNEDNNSGKTSKGLHQIAILNAMNLDKTRKEEYRKDTWDFVFDLVKLRAARPDIPLVLFLHIPLNKPSGMCEPHPRIEFVDGFVSYQDYLSPTVSAYLLHCLNPTIVFNGHDHNGCLATHKIQNQPISLPIALGDSEKTLQSATDLCNMSLEELDAYSLEIEQFAQRTVYSTAASNISAGFDSWSTIEITVRSAMGAYNGVTGIFDISYVEKPFATGDQHQSARSSSTRKMQVFGSRQMESLVGNNEYRYREVALGHHLIVRILLITDLVSCIVVPLIILLV